MDVQREYAATPQPSPLPQGERGRLAFDRCGLLVLPIALAAGCLLSCRAVQAANYPDPVAGDYIVHDFRFATGEVLPELRLHYITIGTPVRNPAGQVTNAVLLLHGTTGTGSNFLRQDWAGTLFAPGQPLDATKYFLILPDSIGNGKSSKPSNGLRARFPHYSYDDMVLSQYRLVTEKLGVDHLRLIVGTSMGGMHAWMWGVKYPEFMDALLPMVCTPAPIAGRNRMQRKLMIDAIRSDPGWQDGNYTKPPQGLATALRMSLISAGGAQQLYREAPTSDAADRLMDNTVAKQLADTDANDFLYAWEASRGYDPSPDLGRIRADVFAVNFADDDRNPPELGVMEREIARVPRGRYILIPASDQTRGHASFYNTSLWKEHLIELLTISAAR